MRAILLFTLTAVLLATAGLARPALAEETTGPDTFASLLLLHNQYGPGPDDGELLDLWLSYFNETNPDLLAEPACYAPLQWAWPEFTATAKYAAEDEYGTWSVTCNLYGVMNEDKLVTLDGVDYPYLGTLTADYAITWLGKDGSSFSTAWSYALVDIPPVAQPGSDVFVQGLPDGLPTDRLTYSLHLPARTQVEQHLNELHHSYATANPAFPDSDYSTASDGEVVAALDYDLIMYYSADIAGSAGE
jgi:hypothetical protein